MEGHLVLDFLDEARQCPDIQSLKSFLQKTMDRLGLSRWAYVTNGQIEHSYPSEWVEHYIRQRYSLVDPVITKGSLARTPFQWSKIAPLNRLSRDERDYFMEAIDYGLVDGLAVPIFGGAGHALFSMASDEKQAEIDRRLATDTIQFVALGFAFHALYDRLSKRALAIESPLSAREAECLLWSSRGKTSWEIGQVMNITERTVVFHIENAKRKLQVKNRSQAAVKAITAGYISP